MTPDNLIEWAFKGMVASFFMIGGWLWIGLVGDLKALEKTVDENHRNAIDGDAGNERSTKALELKVSEQYATKPTMLALFEKTSADYKEAISRVEKRIDEGNALTGKQGDKIDKVVESIGQFQTLVMTELSKKT